MGCVLVHRAAFSLGVHDEAHDESCRICFLGEARYIGRSAPALCAYFIGAASQCGVQAAFADASWPGLVLPCDLWFFDDLRPALVCV